jgi:multiple sugar transport system substrate-binding protein
VTLQFWKFADQTADPALKRAVDRWNAANPNITVNFTTFPFTDYIGTKLTTAFAGGAGPDVFWSSAGQFLDFVTNGVAAPVDAIVDKSQYLPAAINAVTVNGKLYGLPLEMEPLALYYRKDILSAAGVNPPTTWDELKTAAKALTTPKVSGIVVEPLVGAYQNFTWYPFLWQGGGEVVNADWTASALRSDAAAAAFDLWGELIAKGYAPKTTAAPTSGPDPLARGEAAMQICGLWAIAIIANQYPDVKYGVQYDYTQLPIPPGGKNTSAYGGWYQMANSASKHLAEAMEFTKWLWIDDKTFPPDWACKTNSKFSPNTTVNQECTAVWEDDAHRKFTDVILATARAEPRYPNQIIKAVGDGIQAAMFGGKSGSEAAALAADEIDTFLKTYKGAH